VINLKRKQERKIKIKDDIEKIQVHFQFPLAQKETEKCTFKKNKWVAFSCSARL